MLKHLLFLFLLLSIQLGAASVSNIENNKPEEYSPISSLNLAPNPTLAMNPLTVGVTLDEGIVALKRGLGLSEVAENNPSSFTAGRTELRLPAGQSATSYGVLRLRGGGPKTKSLSSTRELQSTEESDSENSDSVNEYLKKESRDNIYKTLLAEVAAQTIEEAQAADNKYSNIISSLKNKVVCQPDFGPSSSEEVLAVQLKVIKIALSRANETKSEANWMNVCEEAERGKDLLSTVIHNTNNKLALIEDVQQIEKLNQEYENLQSQKQQLIEKIPHFQTKAAFAKAKELWKALFKAIQDYQNDSGLMNARAIVEATSEATAATGEAVRLLPRTSREAVATNYANTILQSLVEKTATATTDKKATDTAKLAKNSADQADDLWQEEAQWAAQSAREAAQVAECIRKAAQEVDIKIKVNRNPSEEKKLLLRDKKKMMANQRAMKRKEGKLQMLRTLLAQEKKVFEEEMEAKVARELEEGMKVLEEQKQALERERKDLEAEQQGLAQGLGSLTKQLEQKLANLEAKEKELKKQQNSLEETRTKLLEHEKAAVEARSGELENLNKDLNEQVRKLHDQEAILGKEKDVLKAREDFIVTQENNLSDFLKTQAAEALERAQAAATAEIERVQAEATGKISKVESEAQRKINEAEQKTNEAEQKRKEAEEKAVALEEELRTMKATLTLQKQENSDIATHALKQEAKGEIIEKVNTQTPVITSPASNLKDTSLNSLSLKESEAARNNFATKPVETSPKVLSWYEKKILAAEEEANKAFNDAESSPTEASWSLCKTKAQKAEMAWNELIKSNEKTAQTANKTEKSRLTAEIEQAKTKKALWTEKISFAHSKEMKVNRGEAEQKAAQELSEIQEKAGIAWDSAVEMSRQADIAKDNADRIKIESSYNELNCLAQKAKEAWDKAVETKRDLLSKTSETDKASVNAKIQTAITRKAQYEQQANEALKNAKALKEKLAKEEADRKLAQDCETVRLAEQEKARIEREKKAETDRIKAEAERKEQERIRKQVEEQAALEKAKKEPRIRAEISKIKIKVDAAIAAAQSAREKERITLENVSDIWNKTAASYEKASEYWQKMGEELMNSGKENIVVEYRKAAERSEEAAEQLKQAAEAYEQTVDRDKKWREGNRRRDAGMSTQSSANCIVYALQARKEGNEANVLRYAEAAETYLRSSEEIIQALQFLIEGKEKENSISYYNGNANYSKAASLEYKLKATQARTAGNTTIANFFTIAAEKSECAAELNIQAVQAIGGERDSEVAVYNFSGTYMQASAETMIKMIEAYKAGKSTLADAYISEATKQEHAAKLQESAKVAAQGNNIKEVRRLSDEAEVIQKIAKTSIKKLDKSQMPLEKRVVLATAAIQAAQAIGEKISFGKSPYQDEVIPCYKENLEYWQKTVEAERSGETVIAAKYRLIAEKLEYAAELKLLYYLLHQNGGVNNTTSLTDLSNNIEKSVEVMIKAIEVRAEGDASTNCLDNVSKARQEGNEASARGYTEASETYMRSSAEIMQALQFLIEGKAKESSTSHYNGNATYSKATSLEYKLKAAEARTSDNTTLAKFCTIAADKSERAAALILQAVQACIAGKELKELYYYYSGVYMQASAETIIKAIEAYKTGKSTLADDYASEATKQENAAQLMKEPAEVAARENNKDEFTRLSKEAELLQKVAEVSIKKLDKSQMPLEKRAALATEEIQAVQTKVRSEYQRNEIIPCYEKAIAYWQKTMEAERSGQKAIAAEYRSIAEKLEHAAEIKRLWGDNDSVSMSIAGRYIEESAETMIKAIEIRAAGNTTFAENYIVEAKKFERAAELYIEGSIILEGKGRHYLPSQSLGRRKQFWGRSLSDAGSDLADSARTMVKSIEAQVAKKTTLANSYSLEAQKLERAVDCYLKGSQAHMDGKEEEGIRWSDAGSNNHGSASIMIKSIIALEEGKAELAEAWRAEAQKEEQAAGLKIKSAQAFAVGNNNEAAIFDWAGKYTLSSVGAMMRAIAAREEGNSTYVNVAILHAKNNEKATQLMKKSAEAVARGNGDEMMRLYNEAKEVSESSDKVYKEFEEKNFHFRCLGGLQSIDNMFKNAAKNEPTDQKKGGRDKSH